jgi:hypothetical protein
MKRFCIVTTSLAPTESEAVREMVARLQQRPGGAVVQGGLVYCTPHHDTEALTAELTRALPGVPFVGATSCQGVGSSHGWLHGARAVTALWLLGEGFRFGVASLPKARAGETMGRKLAERALANAGMGSARFALLHSTPGGEEDLVAGLQAALGRETVLLGGSAADEDLSGRWSVFSSESGARTDGMVLAVCDWPGRIASSFRGGAMVTPFRGKVTAAQDRALLEIDHRPAAEVYNAWLEGKLSKALEEGGSVMPDTALHPLGVFRGKAQAPSGYILIHPEAILPREKSLLLFARVEEGEEVVLMSATRVGYAGRGASVAQRALMEGGMPASEVVGGLLLYCAGCMLTLQQETSEMLRAFSEAVAGAPFVCSFCFGEQGCALPGRADHGNLMTGVLLLGH